MQPSVSCQPQLSHARLMAVPEQRLWQRLCSSLMVQSCSGGFSEAFPAFPVVKPGSSRKDPTKPLREGLRGGRRPRCVSSVSLMPWRPKKDTRRTPFHANWHCLQATKDYLYQFHLVACRERLRGDLPDWLWGFPISRLLLLPLCGGEKNKPKEKDKKKKTKRD